MQLHWILPRLKSVLQECAGSPIREEIQIYNVSLAMSYLSAQSAAEVPTPARPVFERNGGEAAKTGQRPTTPPSSYTQAPPQRAEAATANDESRRE